MRSRWSLVALLSVLGSASVVLSGCLDSKEQRCEGGVDPSAARGQESWPSEGQKRAAAAIECDASQIMGRISGSGLPQPEISALHDRTRLFARLALDDVRAGPVVSSRLPLSSAHQQMYEVAADVARASGAPPMLVWATNPWQPLSPNELPALEGPDALATALMRGERRAIALNVRSADPQPNSALVQVSVPGIAPAALQIYRVNWTGTDQSNWTAAELELLGDASSERQTTLLPGITQQLWIQVHPDAAALPGRFAGSVSLRTADATVEVPVDVTVFNSQFPQRPAMHFGGWDYADAGDWYAVTGANREQFIEYLQARYVDTPWTANAVMEWGNLGSDGNAVRPPDASKLSARRFRVFLHAGEDIAGIPLDDSRFAAAVATWAQQWATEIRRLKRAPEEFDLLLLDEPQTQAQAQTIQSWAQAIRRSGAGFRIWVNPLWRDPAKVPPGLIDAADTICLNFQFAQQAGRVYWDWGRELARQGKTVELYAFDGPARRLDPTTYYRLAFWRAFFTGASAVSFWSFGDTGGSRSDNEFAADQLSYSPLFINGAVVRPGKQMEAAAEGIEDAQYLAMLRDVADRHASEPVRVRAQELLDAAADFTFSPAVSASSQWQSQGASSAAEERRRVIGEFLDTSLQE
jgi:hypothetical protein